MQASPGFLRPLAACLLAAMLAACQPLSSGLPDSGQAAQTRAERLAARGDHAGAAAAYEQAAPLAAPGRANALWLAATREWLTAGDASAAGRALARVATPLSPADAREQVRLAAELSLLANQPARALEQLAALQGADDPSTLAVRARALFALGRTEEAVRTLVEREARLAGDTQRLANQRLILDSLAATAARGNSLLPTAGASPVVAGWLELGQITSRAQQNPVGTAGRLEAWRKRYPAHPANAGLVPEMVARYRPGLAADSQVALLLPLSGRARAAGLSVRDGFLAAYYEQPQSTRPRLRFYDVAATDAPSAYLAAIAEGAQLVVGPLTREEVIKLAEVADGSATTLALNFLPDGTITPDRFYQFALSPEDEARAAARRAVADGLTAGLALVPANEWGQRVLTAFQAELSAAGGSLLARSVYASGTTDFQQILDQLLSLRASPEGGGRKAYRPDAQFIFVAAQPTAGRLIRTQLRFNYASRLPVYATSDIHELGSSGNIDLEGVMFPEMPWVLDTAGVTASVRAGLEQTWRERSDSRSRLFAFGYDTFALVSELGRQRGALPQPVPGVTGQLQADGVGPHPPHARVRAHRRGQGRGLAAGSGRDAMTEARHLRAGRDAERAAGAFLERAGYEILARNVRFRCGELDIVALDQGVLALVEVRYRSRRDFGGAAASITATKRARLTRAAQALLQRRPALARLPARFDVVEVGGEPERLGCRLIKGAFDACREPAGRYLTTRSCGLRTPGEESSGGVGSPRSASSWNSMPSPVSRA